MNKTAEQNLLTRATNWLDLYGHYYDKDKLLDILHRKIKLLTKDPQGRLDLILFTALYICRLWRDNPSMFAGQPPSLVARPDADCDKAALEILINRCARLPRRADILRGVGWYTTYVEFSDPPDASDDIIISTIDVYFEALLYEADHEEPTGLLSILLSDAWELYLRAWENNAF